MTMRDDFDQAAAIDRIVFRENERITAGSAAFHQRDPSEMVMAMEEYDSEAHAIRERSALRNEIFAGFTEYLFADGPCPQQVQQRIEGFLTTFAPDLAAQVTGPREWVTPEAVADVLKKHLRPLLRAKSETRSRGALSVWWRELQAETDTRWVTRSIAEMIEMITAEGLVWRTITALAYAIAKALRPGLIASMPLEDIAILSGDKGGRATPCDRIQRLYNRRLGEAGARATKVHFQKSTTAVAKYSAAQVGNSNRSKHRRKPKRKS